MALSTHQLQILTENLVLTNQRAVYWIKEKALILSDLHIGKTAHFRKHGIPIPDVILQKDLERLKMLILYFNAEKLLIVGDLFHAEANVDMATFKLWLNQFKDLEIVLIKGNHDRLSKKIMFDFNIKIENRLTLEPFTFVHENLKKQIGIFTISGHTHPGILIEGKGKQRIKLPCYQLTTNELILPAFSLFTGLNTRSAPINCKSYAFTDTTIFKV